MNSFGLFKKKIRRIKVITFFWGEGFDPSSHGRSFEMIIKIKVKIKRIFITVILLRLRTGSEY